MAYKAATINSKDKKQNGEVIEPGDVRRVEGKGTARTIGGVQVNGEMTLYPGKPPAALLADNRVQVQTLCGLPWPGSAEDRLGKIPNAMEFAELRGLWPTDKEKKLQKFAEAKLANPLGIGKALLIKQGMTAADADAYLKASHYGGEVPDPDDLAPKQARA